MEPTKTKIIAIDIDGVLTIETEGHNYVLRTPNKIAIAFVNLLSRERYYIKLFTSRYEEDKAITEDWLRHHGVHYDKLVMGKEKYDYFIDDKALL